MVFQNNLLMGAAGQSDAAYTIDQSCRFNDDDSAYLYRTFSTGDQTEWTFSTWVKRGTLGARQPFFAQEYASGNQGYIEFTSADKIALNNEGGGTALNWETTALYRDASAWYHIVWSFDSSADPVTNLYVNGVEVTAFNKISTPASSGGSYGINSNREHRLAFTHYDPVANRYDGYLSHPCFINANALEPSSFGETNSTTGQWVPIDVSGLTFGTNGFLLAFQDSSALGDDTSGNGNDFTSSGLAAADQVTDTPTANFCTWNAIDAGSGTLSDGNLVLASTTDRSGTFGMTSDKWAWKITTAASGAFGVVQGGLVGTESTYSAGSGEVLEFEFDVGAGTLEVSVDGASYSSVATGLTSGPYFPLAKAACTADFGQSGFTRDDTSFNYLSTTNLGDPTIADPSAYFQPTIYTGDGASSLAVNQDGNSTFQPDFVWIKNRDATDNHILTDAVRGVTQVINSNTTGAGAADADTLTAFDSDGFTVGADVKVNTSGEDYVGWQWLGANGTVSNSTGDITSTVSANTTAGFSVLTYTGNGSASQTIGHGLGLVPDWIFTKRLDTTGNWSVYNSNVGINKYIILDLTNAAANNTEHYTATPTTSVYTIGVGGDINANTATFVAYCFAEVEGFSNFGSYTGNGSTTGPFIPTGFQPSFIMTKGSSDASDWKIWDNRRGAHNIAIPSLGANTNEVDGSAASQYLDILSNGFKIRGSDAETNGSGNTYIFAAFAETPFKTANAR